MDENGMDGGGHGTDGSGTLKCLDLDEAAPLPDHLAKGEQDYDHFKKIRYYQP